MEKRRRVERRCRCCEIAASMKWMAIPVPAGAPCNTWRLRCRICSVEQQRMRHEKGTGAHQRSHVVR